VSDPVDQAIAQTQSRQVRMAGMQGTFDATGRSFALQVPEDLTWQEACALAKLAAGLPEQLAARRGPRLIVPTVVPRT
jgi:hypothetical protein